MGVTEIDADLLKNMFLAGAKRIDANKEFINDLNVFPVPDGDTGTNMTMTIMSAAREVRELTNPTMESLSTAISRGALRGARGNSGVILSQLFRGFTRPIRDVKVIDSKIAVAALKKATETAYKAVMKPKEGTILTVARCMAEKAEDVFDETDDLEEGLRRIIEFGDETLARTPDLLPVLKQAGVVDSGGQGLIIVLKGAYDYLTGNETIDDFTAEMTHKDHESPSVQRKMGLDEIETADIKYGYCTEFIIMLEKEFGEKEERSFKEYLASIGDSIVCVPDTEIVKVHVHTNDPGLAIQKGLSYGSLTSMKIDNMREQHHELLFKDLEETPARQPAPDESRTETAETKDARKDVGFVSVCTGSGLKQIFYELGVDEVIEGGQTMNPSTEDIIQAVDRVNAGTVFVFPNNKNIVLAAEQAASLYDKKKIVVVPSGTVPQGITAVINYMSGLSDEDNKAQMTNEMSRVHTAEVTYAVRDTNYGDVTIKCGDIMAIGDDGLIATGREIDETTIRAVEGMISEESEIISLYYGDEIDSGSADDLTKKLQELYPDCEIEVNEGGQPLYYYLVSVE